MFRTTTRAVLRALLSLVVTASVPAALASDDAVHRPVTFQSVSFGGGSFEQRLVVTPAAVPDVAQFGAYPTGGMLVARIDLPSSSPGRGQSLTTVRDSERDVTESSTHFGIELPKPNRLSAVLATVALALFFFVRRVL